MQPETITPPAEALLDMQAAMVGLEPLRGVALVTRMLIWGDIVVRTIEIPAGVVLAGAQHQHEHVAVMCGAIDVFEGSKVIELYGAHEWVVAAGVKRAGRTQSATAWTTIHRIPPGMTDPAEIERYVCGNEAASLVTQRNPELPFAGDVDGRLVERLPHA